MMLIPTSYKEKVPKGFKYPVGAEMISHTLSGVPQFNLLELDFSWKDTFWASKHRARINAAGTITVMEIHAPYRPDDIHWTIRVNSVPSTEGQRVRELLEHALQNLKTRMMKETGKCYWKASYDLATHTMQIDYYDPATRTMQVG
jgi:hypothetical protein